MRRLIFVLGVTFPAILGAAPASAQHETAAVVGAGVGGTYYCIVSRCNTGLTLAGVAGVDVARFLFLEAGARRHFCFDCDRYWMGEASALLKRPGRSFTPFIGAGYGLSRDPEFMETTRWGAHVAAGAWVETARCWGVQLALRGRELGSGDRLGELSAIVTRRVGLRAPSGPGPAPASAQLHNLGLAEEPHETIP